MSNNILLDKVNCTLRGLDDQAFNLLAKLDQQEKQGLGSESAALVKEHFSEIYSILRPLKDCSKDDSHAPASTNQLKLSKHAIPKLSKTLQIFENGLLEPSNRELVQLQELIAVYAAIVVIVVSSQDILKATLLINDDLHYYEMKLSSRLNVGLYAVQSLPVNAASFLGTLFHDMVGKNLELDEESYAKTVTTPEWLPQKLGNLYFKLIKWARLFVDSAVTNMKELLLSPTTFLIDKHKRTNSNVKKFISTAIGLPVYFSEVELKRKRDALAHLQQQNVTKLGFLLSEVPTIKPHGEADSVSVTLIESNKALISKLLSIYQVGDDFSVTNELESLSLEDSFKCLSLISGKLLPESKAAIQLQRLENKQPRYLFKYWMLLLVSFLYGPSFIANLISNREAIIDWIELNLVDTTIGFWKNWIVKPVGNILKTIRHDDNSRIAIMSQQSLNSDLESLERMVLDYSMDNYSYITNSALSQQDRSALLENIKNEVKLGNLELVMKGYEHDLKKPVKSIIAGDMIRNLLIQIQKMKVDGAVAISGIDKILRSQELVFGIVAASPSGLIVWYLLKSLQSYLKNGYVIRNTKDKKIGLIRSLRNVERLINLQVSKEDDSAKTPSTDYYNEGLLYLELINLRKLGLQTLPNFAKSDYVHDLNDLGDSNYTYKFKLMTLTRIRNTYGVYIVY